MAEPASDELIAEIEAGLEGVTPGPWEAGHFGTDSKCQCTSVVCDGYAGAIAHVAVSDGLKIGEGGNDCPPKTEAAANMRHIARCHPGNIAALIARIREQDATFTDDRGTVWTRPTAEAYAAACRALEAKDATIKRMDEALEWICDGPHEVTMTYPELVAEISIRARAARKEPT